MSPLCSVTRVWLRSRMTSASEMSLAWVCDWWITVRSAVSARPRTPLEPIFLPLRDGDARLGRIAPDLPVARLLGIDEGDARHPLDRLVGELGRHDQPQ